MFHESLDTLQAPGPRHRRIRPDIPACPGDLRVRDRAGARHAFRVTCPGLFPVALSGLQEHARVAQGRFLPRLVSPGWRGWPRSGRGWMATSRPWAREHVGAAPCGCPSGSNGDALSRRGRRLEHVLVLRGQSRMVSRGIGTLAGHPNGDALSRRGRRLEHVPVLRGQSRMVSRGIGTLAGHPNGDALSRRGRRLEHVPVLRGQSRMDSRGIGTLALRWRGMLPLSRVPQGRKTIAHHFSGGNPRIPQTTSPVGTADNSAPKSKIPVRTVFPAGGGHHGGPCGRGETPAPRSWARPGRNAFTWNLPARPRMIPLFGPDS